MYNLFNMKRNKRSPFPFIITLSFFLIVIISLTTFVFSSPLFTPPADKKVPTSAKTLLIPKFSLSSFIPQKDKETTLLAVGDIMLGRYCNVQMLKQRNFRYPFLKTADLTSSADITFGNLEAPFVENCPTTGTGMIFCARPEAIEGLKFAGFDVLSLANNHILNYGQGSLEQTQSILSSSNILYSPLSSSNNITMKQFNNVNYGFLSFDLVTYPNAQVIEKVKENISKVDVLIVSLHWGAEYQKEPNTHQRQLARQAVDAGAKIVLGHHPHVTQPVESYGSGLIFYSLGNFVFDQPWSTETKKGQMTKIIFEGKDIKSYELIPIYIHDFCQPQLSQ